MAGRSGAQTAYSTMASFDSSDPPIAPPSSDQIATYIEDMLGELAKLAASAGHHTLATTLWTAASEAAWTGDRGPAF